MSLRELLPKDMSSRFRSSSKVVPVSPVDSLNNSLTKNTALHRLVLQYPIQSHLQSGQWYRVNVNVVTEMGILLASQKLEEQFPQGIRLTCSIYHHYPYQQQENSNDSHRKIMLEVEPLMKDIWDADTVTIAPWPGFAPNCCHGGFKYRFPSVSTTLLSKPCYLIIHSTSHADAILPIVVGPVHPIDQSILSPCSTTPARTSWDHVFQSDHTAKTDENCQDLAHHQIYRKIIVNNGYHLLIKERWNCGTSGKLWDSALLMTSLFANAVAKQPDRFANHRILDLSAGTGYIGIYIAKLHQNHPHPPTIILTDTKDALPLLYENQTINQVKVNINPLLWGKKKDARRITDSTTTKVTKLKPFHIAKKKSCPLDIVIASDVLYNAKDMKHLVQTFLDLCTFGKTVIYFGYKNRGLKEEELIQFFQMCRRHFHVDLINPTTLTTQPIQFNILSLPSQSIPHHLHIPYLLQSGACVYTLTRKDKK